MIIKILKIIKIKKNSQMKNKNICDIINENNEEK